MVDGDLRSLAKKNSSWEAVPVAPGVNVYRMEVHRQEQVVYGGDEIEVDEGDAVDVN